MKDDNEKIVLLDPDIKILGPFITAAYMLNASAKQDKVLPLKQAFKHLQTKEPGIKRLEDHPVFCLHLIDLEVKL